MTREEAAAIAVELEQSLLKQALPGRAEYEKKYLKSELRFLGAGMPTVRAECTRLYKRLGSIGRSGLDVVVDALWRSGCHELRSVGICLMIRHSTLFSARDLPMIQRLISESAGWAHVDWLAIDLLGPIYSREPAMKRRLHDWTKHDDFWVRRASMLALLNEAKNGNRQAFDAFSEFASKMVAEKEFFIRKAIGWVLREVSKKQPEWSFEFLSTHRNELSGLTLREGSKYLPAQMRDRLKRQGGRE